MEWDESWVEIAGRWGEAGGTYILDGGPSPGPSTGLVPISLAVTWSLIHFPFHLRKVLVANLLPIPQ